MLYFDTSALVKQYFTEVGSATVRELLRSGEKVFTAVLTYAEAHAAFARRKREGILSAQVTRKLALRFDKDWETYEVVLIGEEIMGLTRKMVYRHPLRSADAIHLATALALGRKVSGRAWQFVCADDKLGAAVTMEGVRLIDVTKAP